MFRVHVKVLALLCGVILFFFNNLICVADVSTMQNGLQVTNTFQHPGNYYNDPSMPTPNPAIFPPPPPKSPYLPTQPFMPVLSGQLTITKDQANKLLNGYTNPSLPTPNPAFYPPPPATQVTTTTTTTETNATSETTTEQTTTTAAGEAGGGGGGTNSLTGSSTSTSGGTNGGSSTTPQPPSNNLQDLQTCKPGTYTFPSPARPITTNSYYGGTNVAPPLMTYSVSGMQNGKCVVSITQSAVVPPTSQNGVITPSATTAPAANISNCNLSPNELSVMVQQAQKNQMGGYYGSNVANQNYYNQQSLTNSCNSYLVVNGAAIPYKSYP